MSQYDRFFAGSQIGGRSSNVGPIYKARIHYQRGRGLSDVFLGLYRFIKPFLVSGSKALGKEALRAGNEILENVGTQSISSLLKEQGNKSLQNLTEKAKTKLNEMQESNLSGKGIKRRQITVNELIASLSKPRKTTKRRTTKKTKAKSPNKKTKKTSAKKTTKKTKKRSTKTSKAAFIKSFLSSKK